MHCTSHLVVAVRRGAERATQRVPTLAVELVAATRALEHVRDDRGAQPHAKSCDELVGPEKVAVSRVERPEPRVVRLRRAQFSNQAQRRPSLR